MCDVGAETVCLNGYAAQVSHGMFHRRRLYAVSSAAASLLDELTNFRNYTYLRTAYEHGFGRK